MFSSIHPHLVIKTICVLVAVGSSGILKGKQKLGSTFNSDKLGGIDFYLTIKFPLAYW